MYGFAPKQVHVKYLTHRNRRIAVAANILTMDLILL